MRIAQTVAVFMMATSVVLSCLTASAAVRWTEDLNQARQVAAQQRKLILLHFYADWCGPCRQADQELFPRTDVSGAIDRNYVPVKVNVDRAPEIAGHFRVQSVPTDIVMDVEGRMLFRGSTKQDPFRYVQLLDDLAANSRFAPPANSYTNNSTVPPGNGNAYDAGNTYRNVSMPQANNQPLDNRTSQYSQPAGVQGYAPGQTMSNPTIPAQPAVNDSQYGRQQPVGDYQTNGYSQNNYQQNPATDRNSVYGGSAAQTNQYADRQYGDGYSGNNAQAGAGYDPRSPQPNVQNNTYSQAMNPAVGMGQQGMQRQYQEASGPSQYQQVPAHNVAMNPTPQNTSVPQPTADEPPLALDGYCVVSLAEEESWEPGDRQWGAIHRGRTYLFRTQQHQQRFLADPDRYSPVLSGYDPVIYVESGNAVNGKRQHGMWFRGKVYLFASEDSLARFQQSPEVYTRKVHDIMMSLGQ